MFGSKLCASPLPRQHPAAMKSRLAVPVREFVLTLAPYLLTAFNGAYSDDDTVIEFVTLHAVERHDLGITYPQIAEARMRRTHRCIGSPTAPPARPPTAGPVLQNLIEPTSTQGALSGH
jgi:hypothetical protein